MKRLELKFNLERRRVQRLTTFFHSVDVQELFPNARPVRVHLSDHTMPKRRGFFFFLLESRYHATNLTTSNR